MVREEQLLEVIKKSKESDKERKFNQSVEMIMVFRDIDVKKGFAINEIIQLPKKMSKLASVCVMASGDTGIKAKNANADQVINEEELIKLFHYTNLQPLWAEDNMKKGSKILTY